MNLQQLKNFLSSSSRVYQGEAGAVAPERRFLWEEWVVGRSLCLFRGFDVPNVEQRSKKEALDIMVRHWAPYSEPEYWAEESGARVAVWAWDGAQRREESRRLGFAPDRILPETVHRLRPDVRGEVEHPEAQLNACINGFEGVILRSGAVVGNRWWSEIPSLENWNQFLLTQDLPPQECVPEAVEQALPASGEMDRASMWKSVTGSESRVLLLVTALFLMLASYQLGCLAYYAVSSQRLAAGIEALSESVTPVLEARNRAYELSEALAGLADIGGGPPQLSYLATVQELIAAKNSDDLSLAGWEYGSDGQVSITVETASMPAGELLTLFETLPWLEAPRVDDERTPNRLSIKGGISATWRLEEKTPVEPTVEATSGD